MTGASLTKLRFLKLASLAAAAAAPGGGAAAAVADLALSSASVRMSFYWSGFGHKFSVQSTRLPGVDGMTRPRKDLDRSIQSRHHEDVKSQN